ncbi:MAG: adenylosuccinate lyase [Clostridia bacterium]
MTNNSIYVNPLCDRYASKEMQEIFSNDNKFITWRKLWIALAESEKELGLDITDKQIAQLKAKATNINYDVAKQRELEVRHDVMSHVYAYGVQCPDAAGIIHLGATSAYVGDNTDIIVMRQGLLQVKKLLLNTIYALYKFSDSYKSITTLAYTHFQSAQPTTVGKRATLWLNELLMDLESIDNTIDNLHLLGCKGTTGTGASFYELFNGDYEKVKTLEKLIARKVDFVKVASVSGQTYSRKLDYMVLSTLSKIAQSAHKFAGDIRLLSHLKEVEEPFESKQIGSSAMAYKRNPMRSERICSLSRFVIVNAENPAITSASQWFERTLDDSANRRISIPQSFLAIDGILSLYINIISGLKIYPKIIEKHLNEELPFMLTENILMDAVKKGGDRQELHEVIRKHSIDTIRSIKEEGKDNDLLERLANDSSFNLTQEEMKTIIKNPNISGCAIIQTTEYLENEIKPILEKYKDLLGCDIKITV